MVSPSDAVGQFLEKHAHKQLYWSGVSLYESQPPALVSLDAEAGRASYLLENKEAEKLYKVEIFNFLQPHALRVTCTCGQRYKDICEHSIASLLALEDDLYAEESGEKEEEQPLPVVGKKEAVLVADGPVSIENLAVYADVDYYGAWEIQRWVSQFQQVEWKENELSGHIRVNNQKFRPTIILTPDNQVICDCNCDSPPQAICKHGYALLMHFANHHNCAADVFFYLRDHSPVVETLLAEYGYSPEDDWQEYFDLAIVFPRVQLFPKDPGLSKAAAYAGWKQLAETFVTPNTDIPEEQFQPQQSHYGLLWCYFATDPDRLYLNVITGKRKKNGDLGAPLRVIMRAAGQEVGNEEQLQLFNRLWITGLTKVVSGEENTLLPSEGRTDTDLQSAEITRHAYLEDLFPELLYEDHYYCEEPILGENVAAGITQRIFPESERPELLFDFVQAENGYWLQPLLRTPEGEVPLGQMKSLSLGLFLHEGKLYLLDARAARTASFFRGMESYRIRHEDVDLFLEEFLMPLMDQHEVRMNDFQLDLEESEAPVRKQIYLEEKTDYLVITPSLTYTFPDGSTSEVYFDFGKRITMRNEETGALVSLLRDAAWEAQLYADIQALHPRFSYSNAHFFSLPLEQVMQQNWFFNAFAYWRQAGFEVRGLKELKNLKYSPYRPTIRLQAGSGTDWFDLEIDVRFGDEQVKLADIRKAILNKQEFVRLGDGSIGVLPEEWLKKYSGLFKVGKVVKGKLTISQFQVSLIEALYEEIDNAEVFEEILEKRRRLNDFREIKQRALPAKLTADLRNYQKEGYNWLNFLDEIGWGGCLADDMGLGKTVQMLAFLMGVSQRNPGVTHLVIVPRSLVFNWVNEVEKFSADYSVLRHTGMDRAKTTVGFHRYDLILTTYGLVRSDIELFRRFPFHYTVLDESQAIKNPLTKTAKSVKLLKTKNRLIMTGTPVENNTFDLYSQMDFVNPGMLGSLESFRREFANAIDKGKDEEVAEQLRRLVYPFILSRKKQQVAKELPEKTETVLYCEMAPAQRKVYDHFKDKYRNLLMEKINSEGYGKAGVYILQGLMKLRQICNSPMLLNGEPGTFTHESAKLEVMFDMLDDIIAEGYKVLIFSFFKGMLNLVGQALTERKVDYVLLTGESQNREALVDSFKNDPEKRAFLISLKAGGFGLNLEEANYVFLVDPWWNPAVEQQAIDRSHRIGQTEKVFAYKLICKDTIEEKILKLQESKKALAADLIHTESGFLKQLKPEDVRDLFS